jgi:hypothetical protein
MSETKALHVHQFDPVLKARLIAEAETNEVSLNDYAVGVLARQFRVKFTPSGRKGPGASVTSGALMLPVPLPLYRKIHAAVVSEGSKRAVVEAVFREHFAKLDAELEAAAVTA